MNCKHFRWSVFGNQYSTCERFKRLKDESIECVDGSVPVKRTENTFCSISRKYEHLCGKEGKSFQQR